MQVVGLQPGNEIVSDKRGTIRGLLLDTSTEHLISDSTKRNHNAMLSSISAPPHCT